MKNRPIFKTRQTKVSKHMAKAINKAEKALDDECNLQTDLIYAAGAIVLINDFKWSQDKVLEYFKEQEDVYSECGSTIEKSMVQMCDEECDIDLRIDTSDRDWRDLIYLNPAFNVETLTDKQWLYMRQQQKKWVRSQIIACFLLTAKRKYKFTLANLDRLFTHLMDTLFDYEGDKDALIKAAQELDFYLTNDPLTASQLRKVEENERTDEHI